jgi:hypothetical protein
MLTPEQVEAYGDFEAELYSVYIAEMNELTKEGE